MVNLNFKLIVSIDSNEDKNIEPKVLSPPSPLDDAPANEPIIGIFSPYANLVCVSRTVNVADAVLIIVNEYASIDDAFPADIAAGTFGVTADPSILIVFG